MPVAKEKRAKQTNDWRRNNPERWNQIQRDWRAKNKEKLREYHLKQYGITPAEYDALFEAQGKKCACCGQTGFTSKNWHVDHDHKTGVVRGIVCHKCNTTLGLLGDSLPKVEESCNQYLSYLRKSETPNE